MFSKRPCSSSGTVAPLRHTLKRGSFLGGGKVISPQIAGDSAVEEEKGDLSSRPLVVIGLSRR